MTISNSVRTAGPFTGNGITSSYPFSFKVFSRGDLLVARTNVSGEESILTLDSDYSVTLNNDQTSAPGGTVTLSSALPTGYTLAMTSNIPNTQSLDLTNNGGFYPKPINEALDRIVVMIQQVSARVGGNLNIGGAAAVQLISKLSTNAGASLIGFIQAGAGAVWRTLQDWMRERGLSVKDFGAVGDGVADDTAALQAALDAGCDVFLPKGKFKFSALMVKNRNTRLYGRGRNSVLLHTGAGAAITVQDASTVEPDGTGVYIESGWYAFEDFELQVNGTFGIRVGKTRSSFALFKRLYIRHLRDLAAGDANNQYFPGSVAIDCDNAPWAATYSTYKSRVEHCFVRGFESAINLQDTVNAWEINGLYTIECKKQVVLGGTTGINVNACYFESGIAGASGITFLGGGGNQISVTATSFELTNAAATQYAFVFAGGTWSNITVSGAKYLIQGDGNGLNNCRISGTAPASFVELNRTYDSATYGTIAMLWGAGVSNTSPFQQPNYSRFGGYQQGNGKIKIARGDTDAADHEISHDGNNNLLLDAYDGGFKLRVKDGAERLVVEPYSGVIRPGADNSQSLGSATYRVSQLFAGTATINTSDEREKELAGPIDSAVLRAWAKVDFLQFKFTASVANKGDDARWHFGVMAQRVKAAFESEGLDAFAYGLLCYDEWPDRYDPVLAERPLCNPDTGKPVLLPNGEPAMETYDTGEKYLALPAGNRYGVRYEEALALECAYLRSKLTT